MTTLSTHKMNNDPGHLNDSSPPINQSIPLQQIADPAAGRLSNQASRDSQRSAFRDERSFRSMVVLNVSPSINADARRLKRYLSTTCTLVSVRAHRLRMSRNESSRAIISASVTPLTSLAPQTDARSFFHFYLSLDWGSAQRKSIQHVLVLASPEPRRF